MGKKKHKGGKHAGGSGAFPAGLFAAVAAQATSPTGKALIAGALRKAADAIDRRPAVPPRAAESPAADTPPRGDVPPEVAKVIGSIAAGLERWAARR